MANENIAILSVMAQFDKNSVKKVARDFNRSMEDVESGLGGLNFDKELINKFNNVMNTIEKKFKKVNLSKYQNEFLGALFNPNNGLSDFESALDNYINKIETLKEISKGKSSNIFDSFNSDQLDKVINDYDKLLKKKTELAEADSVYKNKANEIEGRSIAKLLKSYSRFDEYKQATNKSRIDEIQKEIGVNSKLNKSQEESIERYSKLLSVFELMSKESPKEGKTELETRENAIRHNKELLNLVNEIKETEMSLGKFSKSPSAYTSLLSKQEGNEYFNDFNTSEFERKITMSTSKYIDAGKKTIQNTINTREKQINDLIKDIIQNNVEKASASADKLVQSLEEKNAMIDSKLQNRSKGNFANDGFSGDIYGNMASETAVGNVINDENIKLIDKYILSIDECIEEIQKLEDINLNLDPNNDKDFDAIENNVKEQLKYYARLKNLGLEDSKIEDELGFETFENIKYYFEDLDTLDKNTKKAIKSILELNNVSNEVGGSSSFENSTKDIEKYIVSLDEAKKKAEELFKEKKLSPLGLENQNLNDIKDVVGYMVRYLSLGGKLEDFDAAGLKLLYDKSKVNENIGNEITKLTNSIHNYNEELKESTENSIENAIAGTNTESVEKINEKVQELETSISTMEEKLKTLDGNAFEKMSDDIKDLQEQLNLANDTLKKFQNQALNKELNTTGDVSKAKSAQNEIQKELDETDKKLQQIVYHWGEVNSENIGKNKAEPFSKMISNYITGVRDSGEPWGSFGSGTYVTSDPNYFKGMDTKDKPLARFNAIDISKLNMYETKTTEHAQALYDYLTKLQQYCISFASGYDYQGTFDVNNFDSNSLYDDYKKLFSEINMSFDEFDDFINQMLNLVETAGIKSDGNMSAKANMLVGKDNIATRFMKELGYDGVNNAGTEFDSLQHGSVIFDLDKSNIVDRYKDVSEILELISQRAELAKESTRELNSELSKNNNEKTNIQDQSSPLSSRQDTFEKLQEASNSVAIALNEKTNAIKDDENQMNNSINSEISKLEELSKKLDEVRIKFENGIVSDSIESSDNKFDNDKLESEHFIQLKPIIDEDIWLEELNQVLDLINPRIKKIKLNPDVNLDEWIKKIDNIIGKISPQKISVDAAISKTSSPKNSKSNKTNSTKTTNIDGDDLSNILSQTEEDYNKIVEAARKANPALEETVKVVQKLKRASDDGKFIQSFVVTDSKGTSTTVNKDGEYFTGSNIIRDDIKTQKESAKLMKDWDEALEINKQLDEAKKYSEDYVHVIEQCIEYERQEKEYIEQRNKAIAEGKKQEQEYYNSRKKELKEYEKQQQELESLLIKEEQYSKKNQLKKYNDFISEEEKRIANERKSEQKSYFSEKQSSAYKDLNDVIDRYITLQTRIAKSGDDANLNDLNESKEIYNRINEISKQISERGLFSSSKDEDAIRKLQKLDQTINDINNSGKQNSSSNIYQQIQEESKMVARLKDLYNEQTSTMQQIKVLDVKGQTSSLNVDEIEKLKNLKENLASIEKSIDSELEKEFDHTAKINNIISKISENREKGIDGNGLNEQTLNLMSSTNDMMNKIKASSQVPGFEKSFSAAIEQIEKFNTQLVEGKIDVDQYTNKVNKLVVDLNKVVQVLDSDATIKDGKDAMVSYIDQISKGDYEIKNFGKDARGIETITAEFVNQEGYVEKLKLGYSQLTKEIKVMSTSSAEKMNGFTKWFDELKGKFSDLSKYLISFVGFFEVWNTIKQGISYVVDFDTAMTDLIKVSNSAESALKAFGKESFNIANQVGSTGTAITNAAADWSRLGYSLKEATELAKNSAIYVNVGDGIDVGTATNDIVSAMKAFDIQAEDSISIIDKYNEVGNNFAISSSGIGEAMARSSSSLAAAGNTLDQSIALATAMNEILQDTSTVGTTLKVVALRIRGASTELEAMGESTDGVAESTSKLQKQIKALTNVDGTGGFDIMLDQNTFKSTYDIIKGIYQVWDKMSDIDQAALLELLSGKTRSQGMAALISNFDKAEEVLQTSLNSEGSAVKENEKYMESIQGHLSQLQNSWQQFWNSDITRDQVNPFIDLAKGALDLINNLGIAKTALLALSTTLVGLKAFKGGGRAKIYI